MSDMEPIAPKATSSSSVLTKDHTGRVHGLSSVRLVFPALVHYSFIVYPFPTHDLSKDDCLWFYLEGSVYVRRAQNNYHSYSHIERPEHFLCGYVPSLQKHGMLRISQAHYDVLEPLQGTHLLQPQKKRRNFPCRPLYPAAQPFWHDSGDVVCKSSTSDMHQALNHPPLSIPKSMLLIAACEQTLP